MSADAPVDWEWTSTGDGVASDGREDERGAVYDHVSEAEQSIPSPEEFYAGVTKRRDVREILKQLAER